MKLYSIQQYVIQFGLVFLLGISGCSIHRVSTDVTSGLFFHPLERATKVELAYAPKVEIHLGEHSEFFSNLDQSIAANYQNVFISKLNESNISVVNESERFVIEVTGITFTETAHYECEIDEKTGEKDCFWLNDIDITIDTRINDRQNHYSSTSSSSVKESTYIKSRIISKGFKEGGFIVRNSDYVAILVNSCFKKSAGKAARFIKKQRKKGARKEQKTNENEIEETEPMVDSATAEMTTLTDVSAQSSTKDNAIDFEEEFVDFRTGDRYKTKLTDTDQIWMAENLRTSYFRNGDSIPQSTNTEEWNFATRAGQPTWMYYDNSSSNNATCGKLYNWFAVIDIRGLAPEGWHVSTAKEWEDLIQVLGGKKEAGFKLKTTSGWFEKTATTGNESTNGNGSNESGFSCLPCGLFGPMEKSYYYGYVSYWWCAPEKNKKPSGMKLNSNGKITSSTFNPNKGYSVRCVRD